MLEGGGCRLRANVNVFFFLPRRWISGKVIEILGNEDDVVIDFVYSLLEEERIVCCPFLSLSSGPVVFAKVANVVVLA